jgi:hypothetical protein
LIWERVNPDGQLDLDRNTRLDQHDRIPFIINVLKDLGLIARP